MTVPLPNPELEQQIGERVFKVADGFFRIPLPTGYRIGDVNVWFLDGDVPVLFDTGTGSHESMQALDDALSVVGRRVKDIRHLLMTHAHIDHCGGAGRIAEASGCAVHVHAREVDRVRDFVKASRAELFPLIPMMMQMGFDRSVSQHALLMLDKLGASATPCPSAGELPKSLQTGRGTITWAYVPGHSAADVLFRIEGLPLVITGDHVLPHVTTSPAVDVADGPEYAVSLQRYRDSLGYTSTLGNLIGCAGHGPVFSELGRRASALLATQDRRMERAARVIAKLGPCTALQVAGGLFGMEYRFEMLMFANECAGYARLLQQRGVCEIRREQGLPDTIIPLQSPAEADKAGQDEQD